MANKSANYPAYAQVAGYTPVEHDLGGKPFKASSGDTIAKNHQHIKGKNSGVSDADMLKLGRNLARVKNQGA